MSYEAPSRRLVLKAGLLAGGGLLLSLHLPRAARAAETLPGAEETAFVPNAFIEVPPTGKIIFISPHAEVGQGIYTSTAMLMAEELELGLDQTPSRPCPRGRPIWIGQQATERIGKIHGIAGAREQAGLAVAHELGNAGKLRRDHRETRREGLHQRDGYAVHLTAGCDDAGEHEQVGSVEQLRDLVL